MDNTVGSLRQFEVLDREKEIILGTILGDGHLRKLKTGARLEINHSAKQKDFVFWKYQELKRFVFQKPRCIKIFDARFGKTYEQWRFSTHLHDLFTESHALFYRKGGKKVVPKSIISLFTSPLSLAVWFMDDGGRRNDSYGLFLNSLSFTKKENEILQKCLRNNFSLDSRLHWVQDGYRIYIPSKDAKRFCEVVYPFVIPSMTYKLSYNPVTTSFARLDRARDRIV
ncbi:MAG: hypothetical protein HYT12_03810 [Candidatus Liptonbacteria bacterium]|nr:hypothetical protein [Candidatus Liptonbacteria bacterium]